MKNYYLIYEKIDIGGIETLIWRMAMYLKENNNITIICREISTEMKDTFKAHGLCWIETRKWNMKNILRDYLSHRNSIYILYMYEDFLNLQVVLSGKWKENKCLYYCVHPQHIQILEKKIGIRNYFNNIISLFTKFYMDERNLLFMDSETLNSILNYYSINGNYSKLIYPLPFSVNKNYKKYNNHSEYFNILTIARADFPFKGYMLGMVDGAKKLLDQYPFISYTFISYGEDYNKLEAKINELTVSQKERVLLINGTSPEKLVLYYENASLFIGMGTTILEAANYQIPCIIAKAYSNDFLSIGTFDCNPMDIGNMSKKGIDGNKQIEDILALDSKQYMDLTKKTKRKLIEHYDINLIMKKIEDIQINNHCISPSGFKKIILKLILEYKHIKYRNR